MARLLRNFRYRRLNDPVDPANVSYGPILESILELDEDFYLFPESQVPSLQTLCIKTVQRRSGELFAAYRLCGERLLRERPPGPFDALPPPLCDLLCDLLLWLRDPQSAAVPLYCVLSPHARWLCVREPLTDGSGVPFERLLAARAPRLAELTWTGVPVSRELLALLAASPRLAAFVTDEPLAADDVAVLLAHCPALRVLQMRDRGDCVAALRRRGVVGPALRDLRLVVDAAADVEAVARVFAGLESLLIRPHGGSTWTMGEVTCAAPWFQHLRLLSLAGCESVDMLETPLPALATLSLSRCGFRSPLLSRQLCLRSVSLASCQDAEPRGPERRPTALAAVETLSVVSDADGAGVDLAWVGAVFPRVQCLALGGDVRAPRELAARGAPFAALRRLQLACRSSVLAERALAALPLERLAELSLQYQADDDAPLALASLARCRRLAVLELEGYSAVSAPAGLRLDAVRWLRLRGGTCRPQMVLWLMRCLPRLDRLQLVNMYIVADAWTPLFRQLRAAGVAIDLEGGCTIPNWRRSGIRLAVADD